MDESPQVQVWPSKRFEVRTYNKMSAPFAADFSENFRSYVSDPAKQLNLGYTIVSFWFVAAFFLGLFIVAIALIVMAVNSNYRNGNKSKKGLMTLVWIGFGLMLFGLWTTINSFYRIVAKINANIRQNKGCSLFIPESAQSAADVIASSSLLGKNVEDLLDKRRANLMGTRGVSDEYGAPDARSSLVYSGSDFSMQQQPMQQQPMQQQVQQQVLQQQQVPQGPIRVSASENPQFKQPSQNAEIAEATASRLDIDFPGLPTYGRDLINREPLETALKRITRQSDAPEKFVKIIDEVLPQIPQADQNRYATKIAKALADYASSQGKLIKLDETTTRNLQNYLPKS